jgi:hypothetical protein
MEFRMETWMPHFECWNSLCTVHPKSHTRPIRKSQKYDADKIRWKIEFVINAWNLNNPIKAYEGMQFDFDDIVQTALKLKKNE